jgi:hypothetical protein
MTVISYILSVLAALIVLGVIIEMLRRRRLRERHAIWWMIAGILALIGGLFPTTIDWLAGAIGVTIPINLVFFVSIAILFLVCIQHSAELTDLESETRILAEKITLQQLRIEALERHSGSEQSQSLGNRGTD